MDNQKFWATLDNLTQHLGAWQHGHNLSDGFCETCQSLCVLLKQDDAQSVCADPRNASKVKAVREAHADTWSNIYSHLEFKVAEELWPQVKTYDDFKTLTNTHPLFLNADDVAHAEIHMLEEAGIDLSQARVCMIGPGAIPNTALAFAHKGATMTVVDCYAPACTWVKKWFGQMLPKGQYTVVEGFAEQQDYSTYDVVIVAAMLYNREQVIQALEATQPKYVVLRTTANRRPMSMLMPQTTERDLLHFNKANYITETNPPLKVGNFSLLYKYPEAVQLRAD